MRTAPARGRRAVSKFSLDRKQIRLSNQRAACQFLIVLNDGWRVMHDPLQWVLQRRQGSKWNPRSYCCTRSALLCCIREYCGPADVSQVMQLPEWHSDRDCTATKAPALPEIPPDPLLSLQQVSEPASVSETPA